MGHAVDQHLLSLVHQDLKELITKHSKLGADVSDLRDQQSTLKKLVSVEKSWSEELQMLQRRVQGLEEGFAGVENKLYQTDTTVKQLEQKSEQREEKLEEQTEKVKQLEQEVRSQWNSDIKRDIKKLEQKSEQQEEKLEQLEQEVRSQCSSDIKREHSPVQPFDVESCGRKLAEHYKRTAKVSTSVWSSLCQVELDQIYTRLSWVKKEQTPAGPTESELSHFTDLFTPDKNGVVPKRILVQGQTGIGKSTFVKRLTMDWAKLDDAKITEEQKDILRKFQLVVAINLKEVSKCQSFKEVLSCSRLFPLDAEASTDDLLTYIHNNQEKVLLVFDGYDEYRTTSEAEAQFGNRIHSPIYEIFQGNYLRDCAVLVTTRSSRGDELRRSSDKHAEITGFDERDQQDFMMKVLASEREVDDLFIFLRLKGMTDLAKVPLLNLFFCLMWKQAKEQLTKLVQTETKLYQAMIHHILQYSHKRLSTTQVSKVKEEDYEELLAEIGKVALEALLKGNQLFEYGQLSEKLRGEKSVIVGLCQLSEHETSLEPMEMVSFIHKSIQEYLAAWYITHRCVTKGNLGGVEQYTRTSEDCIALENVFKFVCGSSVEGAAKVFKHLASISASDPSLDLSKYIPDEENATVSLLDVTHAQKWFIGLFSTFLKECFSLGAESEITRCLLECTGGVVYINYDEEILPVAKALSQVALPWTLVVTERLPAGVDLYESLKHLDLLHIPVNVTERSEEIKLGDFVTKCQNLNCRYYPPCCTFTCMVGRHGDRTKFYIGHLQLCGDASHVSVFAELAATIPAVHLSTNLGENQSCMKFLTSLRCLKCMEESVNTLGSLITSLKHLKRIVLSGDVDYACDVLELVLKPGLLALEIGDVFKRGCILTSAGAVKFAGLLPRFNIVNCLELDLTDCCAEAVTMLALSITHKTLESLVLKKINLTSAAATALGQALPEMMSLRCLTLHGTGECLKAEDMKALFGGFNKTLPVADFLFCCFSVRGSLAPLTNSLRLFPNLKYLFLHELDMDEHDLCGLLESFRFIPELIWLSLRGNPLGHLLTSIAPFISNLPQLDILTLSGTDCSEEDKSYVRETLKLAPVQLYFELDL